ncbi:MAG: serine hydrolase [Oscillospiraceae bacterium]|nr:serine hydrolase [Oscillospiraceae bacterium]
MKYIKRVLSLVLAMCTAASLVITAHAETTTQIAIDDSRFEGKTWEEVVAQYMEEHDLVDTKIALGYKNLVTGEEHYINADEYKTAASLYKVPLNMVYTERISKGEMTFDDKVRGVEYSRLIAGSIVQSNNEFSDYLRSGLGGYPTYRRYFCEYMGENADEVSYKFYENNYFTPRQMITCLDTLYQGGDARFPKVIDYMKQAEPNNYFNAFSQDYVVAHKYGYLETGNTLQINDCAIVYTDDPIAIVMFTNGIKRPYTCLANYCTLMAEYTQYHTAIRIEEEERLAAEEAARLAEEQAIAQLDQLQQEREEAAAKWTLAGMLNDADMRLALILCAAVVVLCALLVLIAMIAAIRKKVKFVSAIVTVVLFGTAMLVAIMGPKLGTVVNAPTGDPQETVTAFFDALSAGDYEAAYTYLDYYSGLGLENEPEDEVTRQVFDALKASYSYRLYGDCVLDGLTAKQQVLLDHLDVQRMMEKLGDKTHHNLEIMVQNSPTSSIYDENNQFRPEATQKAYTAAVNELLEKPELYRTTTGMELVLVYTSDGWRIQADDALLHALCGGTAY